MKHWLFTLKNFDSGGKSAVNMSAKIQPKKYGYLKIEPYFLK